MDGSDIMSEINIQNTALCQFAVMYDTGASLFHKLN